MSEREPAAERERLRAELETIKARQALARPLDEALLRAATAPATTTPALIVSLGLFLVGALMAHDAFLAGRDQTGARLVQLVSAAAAVLTAAWRLGGPFRLRRELATLPFPVIGLLETLSEPELSSVVIELHFADTPAGVDALAELVRAKAPEVEGLRGPVVKPLERGAALVVVLTGPARFALATWFRRLARHVLRDVHRGWPLKRVEVVAGSRRRDHE